MLRQCPTTSTLSRRLQPKLVDALAFALRFQGRKRIHNADEIMAEIVAKRLVEHLARWLRRHEPAGGDWRCGSGARI